MPRQRFTDALRCWQSGRPVEAEGLCKAAIEGDPTDADAHRLLAEMLSASGRLAEAIDACWKIVELAPLDAANLRRLAALLSQSGQRDGAMALLERSLEIDPGSARALNNLGRLLTETGRVSEAVRVLERALALQRDYPIALNNLGDALSRLGRLDEAIAHYERALALQPALAKAHAGLGLALAASGRGIEAIVAYERAAGLDPRDPSVFFEVGHLMLRYGRIGNAHAAFCAALELQPDNILAQEGRVMTLIALNRHEEALPGLAVLRIAAPWIDYLPGFQLHAQLHCHDWSEFNVARPRIVERVRRGERVATPFSCLAFDDSPANQRLCAQTFVADQFPPVAAAHRPARGRNPRLRIGYLSADFRDHPVAVLMAGVFEVHDRSRFEIYAFSASPSDGGELRPRLERGVDHFLDVSPMPDAAVAARMAELSIDIAVDLGGHTTGSRTRVLAHRPAPVQVNYLGYPGTLGAPFIDYLIADEFVIPPEYRRDYTEQVVYLPDCFQANDDRRPIGPVPSRTEAGLPDSGFVFCSFNNSYKINPLMFGVWCGLLQAIPGSVLWLVTNNATARGNLRREASARGADGARLIFAERLPYPSHMARFGLADLFLDTLPFNAGTTASDALWAGVPVLTCAGESFAARMAGSLLRAVGLPELITHSLEDYERGALELACQPERLARLRARLAANRHAAPLFNTPRHCRHLEAAYAEMWARHERGEKPSTLWVARLE